MANKEKKEYGAGETLKDRAKRMKPMTDSPATYKKWKRTKEIIKKIKKCPRNEVYKGGKCVLRKGRRIKTEITYDKE